MELYSSVIWLPLLIIPDYVFIFLSLPNLKLSKGLLLKVWDNFFNPPIANSYVDHVWGPNHAMRQMPPMHILKGSVFLLLAEYNEARSSFIDFQRKCRNFNNEGSSDIGVQICIYSTAVHRREHGTHPPREF